MIKQLEEDVINFLNQSGSSTTYDAMIRSELVGLGVISGDEGMTWQTPNKEYTVHIKREDGQLWMDDSRFINILKFYNNLGTMLAEVRFNEIFMIQLLYQMIQFAVDEIGPFDIACETYNLTMESYLFRFNRTHRDTLTMELLRFSRMEEYFSKIFRMPLYIDHYNELIFRLFFGTLSDIEVAAADTNLSNIVSQEQFFAHSELASKLNYVEQYVAMY